jgi:hypothetical protein
MRLLLAAALFLGALALSAPAPALAAICANASCSSAEVGPFMQNISKACGNTGDCSLADIMSVVKNVGNFALGIVGSIVLLMYVWGGMEFLTAGGNRERVTSGMNKFKTATIGLVIVFVAYALVNSIARVIQTGTTETNAPIETQN